MKKITIHLWPDEAADVLIAAIQTFEGYRDLIDWDEATAEVKKILLDRCREIVREAAAEHRRGMAS
jgi:hypothetical protein